jgi:hypothetical protein
MVEINDAGKWEKFAGARRFRRFNAPYRTSLRIGKMFW